MYVDARTFCKEGWQKNGTRVNENIKLKNIQHALIMLSFTTCLFIAPTHSLTTNYIHFKCKFFYYYYYFFNSLHQWWPTFFAPRHTWRVSHDQNRALCAVHVIFKKFWRHTSVPRHTGWPSLLYIVLVHPFSHHAHTPRLHRTCHEALFNHFNLIFASECCYTSYQLREKNT
jgi:hypothetical protein